MEKAKARKGFALAELLMGIVILSGVLVAMSQFLAEAMLAMARAQDMSNALLDSYAQVQWIAFRSDLSGTIVMVGGKQVKVVRDTEADDIEIDLDDRDDIKLVAYDVGEKRTLRVYRLANDDDP
ncbi:MAG: hypothetical protein IJR14_01370 [Synergistaceae bacterium]|nr:hypothetical protein [Synergistaceae bacterium]